MHVGEALTDVAGSRSGGTRGGGGAGGGGVTAVLLCETLGGAVRTAPGILSHMGAPKEEAGMKASEWACVSLKERGGVEATPGSAALAGCPLLKRNSWRYLLPRGETDGGCSSNSPTIVSSLNDRRDAVASCHQSFVFLLLICVGGGVDLLNRAFVGVKKRRINNTHNFTSAAQLC